VPILEKQCDLSREPQVKEEALNGTTDSQSHFVLPRREIASAGCRHQPYESGSVTPNAIKIAMRAKQAPVTRSRLILGMKLMK
jgi:hypothetical protein